MLTAAAPEVTQLQFAKTVISLIGDRNSPSFNFSPVYKLFLVKNGPASITLKVHYGDVPNLILGNKVFESGAPWSLYHHGDRYLLKVAPPDFAPQPYCLGTFSDAFDSGELFFPELETIPLSIFASGAKASAPPRPSLDGGFCPLVQNLDQIMLIHFMARKSLGLMIHSFGLIDQDQGLAFCGISGAGKTTLAEIWGQADVTRLSDERLIVRRQDGRFWIYGTPWHGDLPVASPAGAPLAKLYFISQSPHNFVKPLAETEAAARLLVRCYPPFYDQVGMENVLKLISEIAAEVPCHELGFVPDDSIIPFVRGLS